MSPSPPRRPRALAFLVVAALSGLAALPAQGAGEEPAPGAYVLRGPIVIGQGANFAAIAAANGWPGNGSPANPYVIAGYEITSGGTFGHAIFISHQTAWVVIRDNYIHGSPQGIRLQYGANALVTNNRIEGLTGDFLGGIYSAYNRDMRITNNVVHSTESGVVVEDFGPSTIAGNTITGGRFGIRAWSNNQVVTGNTVTDASVFGIWDYGGTSTIADNVVDGAGRDCIATHARTATVLRNTLRDCGETGIRLPSGFLIQGTVVGENTVGSGPVGVRVDNGNGVVVRGNSLQAEGDVGIRLTNPNPVAVTGNTVANHAIGVQASGGRGHTIAGNVLRDNGAGLSFHGSSLNTVRGNHVTGNDRGIVLNASEGNLVYDNRFENAQNALVVDGFDNTWNVARTPGPNIVGGPFLGGNFWSDYTGIDVDADGLGELAHGPIPAGALPAVPPAAPPGPALPPPPAPGPLLAPYVVFGPYDQHPLMTGPVAVGLLDL